MGHLALPFADVANPIRGRIGGLGQEIAFGEHEEHGLAADFRAMPALMLE